MLKPIDKIQFKLNNVNYTLNNIDLNLSLNVFIRSYAQLNGTKFMCRENGCGVCTVNLIDDHFGVKRIRAVNSCTYPIQLCHGKTILTIEGIGNSKTSYSMYQKILAAYNGTQCGYCSPGIIMNLHGLLESKDKRVTIREMENSFGGNLCRCTGYRSILDACKSFCIDADSTLIGQCKDIEDTAACTKKECAQACESERRITINQEYDKQTWYQLKEMQQLIDILKSNIQSYKLVSGNTAESIYRCSNYKTFIDINSIKELTTYKLTDFLEIGANVTLSEVMEIFSAASNNHKNFKYLFELNRHLDLVATVQVRNIGTIGGNLMIKHQHNEFPSDLFVLLDTIDAHLEIIDTKNNKNLIISMVDFLKLNMNNKIILKIIIPELISECCHFGSYKIMPKSQNAHAYINCGFLLQFDKTTKQLLNARLCYGGINESFQHAHSTEQYLVGNVKSWDNLFTNKILHITLKMLSDEIIPNYNLPDELPSYRKSLAVNLFYKFLLNIFPTSSNYSKYDSGKYLLERTVSSGKQTFETYEKYWPLTKPVPKLEGLLQSTGELVYANDIPNLPDQLWAAFVIATQINENILRIDAKPALKIPGVVAFYFAGDIPGKNTFTTPGLFGITENEKIFCTDNVEYYGQPVGIIVAETLDLANMACGLVEITYSKTISNNKIYITVDDVLRDNQIDRISKIKPFTSETAGIDESFLNSITGSTSIGGQFHHSMEPQTCITYLIDDEINVHSATQWLDLTQIAIAECLNLSQSSVNVDVRRLGGGFGGKISRATQIACACALATFLSKRPVRFVMTIESNMVVIGKRCSCQSDYCVKFDANGKIWKLDNVYYQDLGSSLNEDPTILTTQGMTNSYDKINWSILGHIVRTQTPSNTWCRAPGTAEGIAMIEFIIEHIARQLDIDPIKIRQVNMKKNSAIHQMFNKFIESTEYVKRRADINTYNSKNIFKKKGISIIPMTFPIMYIAKFPATVSIFANDGSVIISHGGIEMGQGINTKLAQVASFILEIPIELIKIKSTNTTISPNSGLTGASTTSESVGYAVKKSCEILNERLKTIRNEMKDSKWSDVTKEAFKRNIDLTASYVFKETDVQGYEVLGISCSEVEVDILTGNYIIQRVDIIEETGESMNPAIDLGQIEGAFTMGLGYWLFEKLTFHPNNGNLLTNRTWNYKIPGAKDIPIDFRITLCQKNPNEFGILRSKTAGEPAFAMAIVAVFALQMAISAARKENKDSNGDFNTKLPVTPAHVLQAIGGKIDRLKFYCD